jgi:hypothetical protein
MGKNRNKRGRGRLGKAPRANVSDAKLLLYAPPVRIVPTVPECKHKYFDVPAANVTSITTVTDLFAPSQGVASNQRTGDDVRLRGIKLRAKAYCLNANTQSTFRLVCFLWNVDSTILAPTGSQVFNIPGAAADTPCASLNTNVIGSQEMTILCDVMGSVSNGGPGAWHFDFTKEFQSAVTFEPAAITGIGKVFVAVVSDAAINVPVMSIGGVVLYDDA